MQQHNSVHTCPEQLEAHPGDLVDDRRVVAVPPAAVDVHIPELLREDAHLGFCLLFVCYSCVFVVVSACVQRAGGE